MAVVNTLYISPCTAGQACVNTLTGTLSCQPYSSIAPQYFKHGSPGAASVWPETKPAERFVSVPSSRLRRRERGQKREVLAVGHRLAALHSVASRGLSGNRATVAKL